MTIQRYFLKIALGLVFVLLVSCAPPPAKTRYLYPAPPNLSRVEWIGTYSNENDFPREGVAKVLDAIAGQASAEGFDGPIGVAVNSKGLVLVSDLYLGKILGVDVERGDIFPFTIDLSFRNVLGLAIDGQDRVFVADGLARNVSVLSPSGKLLYLIGGEEVFGKPSYLAINNRLGRLYVSDVTEHIIKVFSLDGQLLFSFGGVGGDEGHFNAPQGIAIDRDGRVFVADMLNARIQVFDADGKYLYQFGQRGIGRVQFETPKALTFDSEGHLYVVDSRRGNFRIFQPDGVLLLEVGGGTREGRNPLGLTLPVAIHIDARDRIFVVDLMNRRLAHWQYLSERYLREKPL